MRRLLHIIVVLTLLTMFGQFSASAQSSSDDAPLDLSAMMLTPDDLDDAGLEGYGLRGGWTDTLDEELTTALSGGDLTPEDVEEILAGPGLIRSRAIQLDLPSDEDPGFAARRVALFIDEYESDDGLDDVVAFYSDFAGSEEAEGNEQIGDDSALVTYVDEGSNPAQGMMLVFSVDNLIGIIQIHDYDDYSPNIEPSAEEIEALGLNLAEKMEDGLDGDGPGLDSRVLRFDSDGVSVWYNDDFYTRLDEDSIIGYGESADDLDARQDDADDAGIIDSYAMEQLIGSDGVIGLTWRIRVSTFEDEGAAAEWFENDSLLFSNLGEGEIISEPEEVDDLGDEAITWSFSQPGNDPDVDVDGFILGTAIRVDTTVAAVYLARWAELPPDDLLAELAEDQAACLEDGDCIAESPAPDDLLELAEAEATGPIADPDEPTEEPTEEPSDEPTEEELLDRVDTYDDLSIEHTEDPVEYEQTPPVGGMHNPVPQTCGFYDEPVGNEHAAHSLEHGAVWVTYDPDLPASDVQVLEDLADEHDYLIVSPFEDLPAPVVASAWGVQILLDGVDDPYLIAFIDYYEQGPQTPEPGAACQGTDETVS